MIPDGKSDKNEVSLHLQDAKLKDIVGPEEPGKQPEIFYYGKNKDSAP